MRFEGILRELANAVGKTGTRSRPDFKLQNSSNMNPVTSVDNVGYLY